MNLGHGAETEEVLMANETEDNAWNAKLSAADDTLIANEFVAEEESHPNGKIKCKSGVQSIKEARNCSF